MLTVNKLQKSETVSECLTSNLKIRKSLKLSFFTHSFCVFQAVVPMCDVAPESCCMKTCSVSSVIVPGEEGKKCLVVRAATPLVLSRLTTKLLW